MHTLLLVLSLVLVVPWWILFLWHLPLGLAFGVMHPPKATPVGMVMVLGSTLAVDRVMTLAMRRMVEVLGKTNLRVSLSSCSTSTIDTLSLRVPPPQEDGEAGGPWG